MKSEFVWCVVHTQPMQEQLATINLENQGFEVYYPKFQKERRHARKVETVIKPLFPRYVFIRINLDETPWRSINGTRGVSYLIMENSNKPATLNDIIIHELKNKEENGLVPVTIFNQLKSGEKVIILKGPLQGQKAYVKSLNDQGRATLLISLLGKDVIINSDYESFDKII